MGIVVETGTGIPDAYSVATEADVIRYCGDRGIDISEKGSRPNLIKAMDILNTFDYLGCKEHDNNLVPFPRTGIEQDGEIPRNFKQAQLELSYQFSRGMNFDISVDDSFVTEEQLGPLKQKFEQRVNLRTGLDIYGDVFKALITPLLNSSSNCLQLKSARG